MSGYLGKNTVFEGALVDFSVVYADQNECDYVVLLIAIRTGHVEARMAE